METERVNGFSILGALFVGGAVGAAAGILLAPKSGRETRQELKDTAEKTLEGARHFYEDALSKADSILEDAKRKADDLRKEADRHFHEASQKARSFVGRGGERSERGPANPFCIESPEEIVGGMS